MKKLLVLTSVVASLSAAPAFAKTEGNYVGVDLLSGNANYSERYSDSTQRSAAEGSAVHGSSDVGFGLNFKHAHNFDGLFVAGGVFVEQNGVKTETVGERLEVKNRFGLKADVGYDVTDNFAPYVTFGYADVAYRTKNYSNSTAATSIKNGVTGGVFYGVGLKFDINKDWSFNTEYQTQNFRAKTRTDGTANYSGVFKSNFSEVKFGLAHRF